MTVYLLWLDHSVLDVYDSKPLALAAVETYQATGLLKWHQSRPDRWYSVPHGRMMEIDARKVKKAS